MRKNLKCKILLSLLAAGSISMYGFANTAAAAEFILDHSQYYDTTGLWTNYYIYSGNGNLSITTNSDIPADSSLPEQPSKYTAQKFAYAGNVITGNNLQSNNTYEDATLTINGGDIDVKHLYGYRVVSPTDISNLENITIKNNQLTVKGGNFLKDVTLRGAESNAILHGIKLLNNSVYIDGLESSNKIYGIFGADGYNLEKNNVTIKSSKITIGNTNFGISGALATSSIGETIENSVNIIDSTLVVNDADGYITGAKTDGNADNNKVTITNSTVMAPAILGAFAGKDAINNIVTINGTSKITGELYAGTSYNQNCKSYNNTITLQDIADMSDATLYGSLYKINDTNVYNNRLKIDNWNGSVQGAYNFSDIDFSNIKWQKGSTVLNITDNTESGALSNTNINLNSLNFEGGSELNAGDSMTFINGENLGIGKGTGKVAEEADFTAGVATVGTGKTEVDENGNWVKYTLTEVKQNSQINLIAENRAVAAAFINQGTDLISDSLDTLSRDSNYGVKTFAAVHGNRSKYDVNSDIKINGWSTIVGVGAENEHKNGDFSWGLFYENGSGNYRTYNEFNNEFFSGDGSLVYNGGGIAARYERDNGVYTEGSLRAGMLKSDMDKALRDGTGNFYGYDSESAYYGAHIGIGKVISLDETRDIDVYGKFFHTYTEGDSFKVANDEFEFDDITSDRLRIGARITENRAQKFSAYYGIAYEYEFNGDADMKAAGMSAPQQSLQGSSYMAEIGFNYQPDPDSPWSFDLNLRGYAGEREGGSFNVQATYSF